MNAREMLLLEYEGLPNGTSLAGQLCPACQGGSEGERTLSVTRTDEGLVWMCHRASCTFRGGTGGLRVVAGATGTRPVPARGVVGRTLAREARALDSETRSLLTEKYSLQPATLTRWQVGWDDKTERVILPTFDLRGEMTGAMLRSFKGAQPKAISHTEPLAMAWYPKQNKGTLVIVEDQLSAMRTWQYGFSAVALLGTEISMDRAIQLKKSGYKRVLLALDKDATPKAVKHVVMYRSILPMLVLPLGKDIKDQTEQELTRLFAGLS